MKMKNFYFLALLLLPALHLASQSAAAEQPRFMGYFANSDINGNHDHTNLTHIWASLSNRNDAKTQILAQLQIAKQQGVQAVVMVDSFLFNSGTASGGQKQCPFTYDANAPFHWASLVKALISSGYLVPNNPAASTVAAFNPVDEPELCGMKDSGGQAHPSLANAIATIRGHRQTSHFPLFVISSKKYNDSINGIHLFDWVGLDNYSVGTGTYLSQFSTFESRLLPQQRSVLVPQASAGGFMAQYGSWHSPLSILDRFLSDPNVIGIMPFLWSHPDTTGTKDIPQLKSVYTEIGRHIKLGTPLPLRPGMDCVNEGGGFFYCSVNGIQTSGVAPFSYSWSNGGTSQEGSFHITCGFPTQISVTVTDSTGARGTAFETLSCTPGTEIK